MLMINLLTAIVQAAKRIFWRTPKPYGLRHFDTPASLYEATRLFWGWDVIVAKTYKALAELAIALVQRDIESKPSDRWKEKVVDVLVMWEQLTLLWPHNYQHVLNDINAPEGETARSLLAATMQLLAKNTTLKEEQILANLPAVAELAWPGIYENREFHLLKAHKIRRLERQTLRIYRRAEWQESVKLAGIQPRSRNGN